MITFEPDPGSKLPFLVVTGSSAGGIDALCSLVASLPADFSAPVVIAQHLAPTHESRLADILATKTPLSVATVNAQQPLEAGTIYLVGPDHDIEIIDDHASTYVVSRKGPKPSIDRLFASAAETHGERVIAIIFSGMGSDGTAGARVVKEHGGTVIVQEASSAAYPSMPQAIPSTLVDLVARPEEMGAVLAEFMHGVAFPETPNEQNVLRTILLQLRERSGVDFTQYKSPTIMRRLSRLMVAAGIGTIPEYLRYLQAHPEAYQTLIGAFLIKVTDFFRDAVLFDELRKSILPQLIETARSNGSELRMWSAGTSTGEEAYSLAIACAELMRDIESLVPVRIFATDLDDDAIVFARRGLYSADAVRQLPPDLIERYFTRVGDSYEIIKRIRNMTVFGQHDLGQRAPFPRIDLCLCRNVLIYFTRELQARALQLFAFSLRDGGYLVLGKSESAAAMSEYFYPVNATLKIYRRDGDRILIPPGRVRDVPRGDALASDRAVMPGGASLARAPETKVSASERFGAFLAHSPIGVAIVDRRYDLVGLNAAARALLEIHGVGIGDDLIHLTRGLEANELRELIDAAFRNEAPIARNLALHGSSGAIERWLQVAVSLDGTAPVGRGEMAAIVMIDVTDGVRGRLDLEAVAAVQDVKLGDVTRHIEDLDRRYRSLLASNDELASANDDLRSLNERLQIVTEESASANEEIEALNEEMQATNEELETLNEELQATVEELNTTNDELESRGAELARIAETRESELSRVEAERRGLTIAIECVSRPVVVVHASGNVIYAARSLGGRLTIEALPPQWWHQSRVTIDLLTYALSVQRDDDNDVSIVTFDIAP